MASDASNVLSDYGDKITGIDIQGAMKIVMDILGSAVTDDANIHGVVMLVALDDGTYHSCEAFGDNTNTNAMLLAFIARLVRLHTEKHKNSPAPDISECPARRTIN